MTTVITYARNTRGRDLIVGDIHGCFTKLGLALAAINFDGSRDRLFSVGDLCDRGPESALVLDWLGQPWFHAIRGNHEDMLVGYHDGQVPADLFAVNGGSWAVAMTPEERLPIADAFRDLPLAIELETCAGMVALIHAEMASGVNRWAEWRQRLLAGDEAAVTCNTWARKQLNDVYPLPPVEDIRALVAGHTPTFGPPVMRGNRFWIDTGAWLKAGQVEHQFCILDAHTLAPVTGGTAQLDLRGFGG